VIITCLLVRLNGKHRPEPARTGCQDEAAGNYMLLDFLVRTSTFDELLYKMPRFLCYCPDYPDALERRLAVRPDHLVRAKKDLADGTQSESRMYR